MKYFCLHELCSAIAIGQENISSKCKGSENETRYYNTKQRISLTTTSFRQVT